MSAYPKLSVYFGLSVSVRLRVAPTQEASDKRQKCEEFDTAYAYRPNRLPLAAVIAYCGYCVLYQSITM